MTEDDVKATVAELNRTFFGGRLRPQLKFHRYGPVDMMHGRNRVFVHRKLLIDPEKACTLLCRELATLYCSNEKRTDEYRYRQTLAGIGITQDDGRVQQFGPFQAWLKEWLPVLALPNWARP